LRIAANRIAVRILIIFYHHQFLQQLRMSRSYNDLSCRELLTRSTSSSQFSNFYYAASERRARPGADSPLHHMTSHTRAAAALPERHRRTPFGFHSRRSIASVGRLRRARVSSSSSPICMRAPRPGGGPLLERASTGSAQLGVDRAPRSLRGRQSSAGCSSVSPVGRDGDRGQWRQRERARKPRARRSFGSGPRQKSHA
jgi:hypothetical protein